MHWLVWAMHWAYTALDCLIKNQFFVTLTGGDIVQKVTMTCKMLTFIFCTKPRLTLGSHKSSAGQTVPHWTELLLKLFLKPPQSPSRYLDHLIFVQNQDWHCRNGGTLGGIQENGRLCHNHTNLTLNWLCDYNHRLRPSKHTHIVS